METVNALCDLMGPAKAVDHRFSFTTAGDANLLPEPGAHAWGTLWMVPASVMGDMDETARAKGFVRGVIFIVSPAGPKVPATVYYNPVAEEGKPTPEGLKEVMEAAQAMKLDRRFIRELKGWGE